MNFDSLSPDPDLVERFRRGVRAHNARSAVRDGLVALAIAPEMAVDLPPQRAIPRRSLVPSVRVPE